jgi:hypothetical protein
MNEIVPSQSGRAHTRVHSILQRRGIEGLDLNSPEGQFIRQKSDEYSLLAESHLPDMMKSKLIQIAVETELLKNSAMTSLITLNPKTGEGDRAKSQRQAFLQVVQAYKSLAGLQIEVMKLLQGGQAATVETPETLMDRLNKSKGATGDVPKA